MDLGISTSNVYGLKDRLIFSTTPWRSMMPLEKWISSSRRDRDMAAEEVTKIRNIYLLTCYLVHSKGRKRCQKVIHHPPFFMEDDEGEVNVKMKKAYCPPKIAEGNPCLEYIKYLVLLWFNEFTVEQSADNGGNETFKSFEELATDYESGELHPGDLKPALAKALNKILEPVREHFRTDIKAKELLKRVKIGDAPTCPANLESKCSESVEWKGEFFSLGLF